MKLFYDATMILDIIVNDNSYRYRAIRGDHSLTLYYSLPQHIEIPVGAWCEYEGERYQLFSLGDLKKHGNRNYEYTLILKSRQTELNLSKMKNSVDNRLKFNLTAKPHEHLQVIVDNLNRRSEGWVVGECINAAEKLISYNHVYCADSLNQLADEFETEWEVVGQTIHLRKVEYNKDNPLPLSIGKGKGLLPGVGRANLDDHQPIDILYVQGSERNIDPSKYKYQELHLPRGKELEYEGRVYIADSDGYSVRRKDALIRIGAEDSLDCSHIYPNWEHVITKVQKTKDGFWDIYAENTDEYPNNSPASLNYNDCRIQGERATIIIQSGMLAGKELELVQTDTSLSGYDHAEKRFEIVSQEIDGQTMPNDAFAPKVGERFRLFGINLPDTYVCDDTTKTGAAWDMFREAVKHLYEREEPQFTVSGTLNGIWAKQNWLNVGGKIRLGGYVLFSDPQFFPDGSPIRITGIKDYINNPQSPEIEMSNNVVGGSIRSDIDKPKRDEVVRDEQHKDAIKYTKRRWRDAVETMSMIERAFGDLYDKAITPISISTMGLLIGDESLQYKAPTLAITYDDISMVLKTTATPIIHQTLGKAKVLQAGVTPGGKGWSCSAYVSPPLTDAQKGYYLYIKARRTTVSATPFLSETPLKFDDKTDSDNYNLLVGVLSSEYEGCRSFAKLFGYTEILPGRITADEMVIQANKTTIAGDDGTKIAVFSGVNGGLVEMQNVKINGMFATAYNQIEITTSNNNSFLPTLSNYNFAVTTRLTDSTSVGVKVPLNPSLNGVVLTVVNVSNKPLWVDGSGKLLCVNGYDFGSNGAITKNGAIIGSNGYIQLQCIAPNNSLTGWLVLGGGYFYDNFKKQDMTEFIKTGEFHHVQVYLYVILAMWLLMIIAVCIDLWAGTESAKTRGEKIYSGGLRRTFSKLGDYWRVQVMALIFDAIGCFLPWYNLPFASMLVTAGVVLIEARSVWENEKAKKSQVSKLPDAIRDIIKCTDAESAKELFEKLTNKKEN